MEDYIVEDVELRERFRDLKINVRSSVKISNVVAQNEILKSESSTLQNEVKRLREYLINPEQKYDKQQDRELLNNLKIETTDMAKVQLGA